MTFAPLPACSSASTALKAHSIARNRAEELKAAGDDAGYAAFTRVAAAVKELGQLKPEVGERRH